VGGLINSVGNSVNMVGEGIGGRWVFQIALCFHVLLLY